MSIDVNKSPKMVKTPNDITLCLICDNYPPLAYLQHKTVQLTSMTSIEFMSLVSVSHTYKPTQMSARKNRPVARMQ